MVVWIELYTSLHACLVQINCSKTLLVLHTSVVTSCYHHVLRAQIEVNTVSLTTFSDFSSHAGLSSCLWT